MNSLHCIRRGATNYVGSVRTLEWLKHDNSAVQAEFEKGRFIFFFDKQPLLLKDPETFPSLNVNFIDYQKLVLAGKSLNFPVGIENSALLSIDSLGHDNDSDDMVATFAYGLRSKDLSFSDPSSLDAFKNGLVQFFTNEGAKNAKAKLLELRLAMLTMQDPKLSGLIACGQSLLQWSKSFKFCPSCGSRVVMKLSKSCSTCHNCQQNHFPPVSPVGICLIRDRSNQSALLVKLPAAPQGMFTCVSGFSEPGETIEETVTREIAEEVGLEVTDLTYAGVSQSWPLPKSSLMLGFFATAVEMSPPQLDKSEIADADWFSREKIREAVENTEKSMLLNSKNLNFQDDRFQSVPPSGAIANRLIQMWLAT